MDIKSEVPIYVDESERDLLLLSKRKCQICFLKIDITDMIPMTNHCEHEMCRDCFRKTIELKCKNKDHDKIQCLWCPAFIPLGSVTEVIHNSNLYFWSVNWECPNCKSILKREEIKQIKNESESMENQTSNDIVNHSYHIICHKCLYVWCTSCNGSHNKSISCTDYLATHETELQTLNWKLENSKRCPRCYIFIEKNGGCSLMHCKCGYEFCFNCLKHYNTFHNCSDNERNRNLLLTLLMSLPCCIFGSWFVYIVLLTYR